MSFGLFCRRGSSWWNNTFDSHHSNSPSSTGTRRDRWQDFLEPSSVYHFLSASTGHGSTCLCLQILRPGRLFGQYTHHKFTEHYTSTFWWQRSHRSTSFLRKPRWWLWILWIRAISNTPTIDYPYYSSIIWPWQSLLWISFFLRGGLCLGWEPVAPLTHFTELLRYFLF